MNFKVCILLPKAGLYPGLGAMLADAFRALGWQPTVRHRADASLLDHDLLLLAGLCRHIEGLPKLLAQRRGKSPATILWQLEPLPPTQLSQFGEEAGGRVAACDWGRIPLATRRVLAYAVPFRTRLIRLARRWLARSYSRQVVREPDHEGWLEYDVENYYNAMAEWVWIKRAHANGGLDHCFASVQPRVHFLRQRGIATELAPFGYHPEWGRDRQLARDIDVLFLGGLGCGPRNAKLRRMNDELARRGRKLTFVRKAFGPAREELLSRTRIMLNLLRVPHDLAGMRVLMGMACGALVVSESCADTGAFMPGEHFVTATLDQLAATIEFHLDHEAERQKIARRGHQFVTEELTLPKVVRRMLELAAVTSAP